MALSLYRQYDCSYTAGRAQADVPPLRVIPLELLIQRFAYQPIVVGMQEGGYLLAASFTKSHGGSAPLRLKRAQITVTNGAEQQAGICDLMELMGDDGGDQAFGTQWTAQSIGQFAADGQTDNLLLRFDAPKGYGHVQIIPEDEQGICYQRTDAFSGNYAFGRGE